MINRNWNFSFGPFHGFYHWIEIFFGLGTALRSCSLSFTCFELMQPCNPENGYSLCPMALQCEVITNHEIDLGWCSRLPNWEWAPSRVNALTPQTVRIADNSWDRRVFLFRCRSARNRKHCSFRGCGRPVRIWEWCCVPSAVGIE